MRIASILALNMNPKRLLAASLLAAAATLLVAEDASPIVTLDEAIASARASGDDFLIVSSGLEAAKRQRELDLAKQSLSVAASGAYSLADGFGDDEEAYGQGVLARAVAASSGSAVSSSYAGVASSPSASVSVSSPLTKATLSATQAIPVPQKDIPTVAQSSVVGLTLNQTVWDGYPGGQYRATLEKSRLAYEGRELSARQGGSAAAAKVKQAYIAMLAAQRDLDIKKQVLDKQSRLLAQIEAVYALKQASAIDLRTAQVNARAAELDLKSADKALRLANERLAVVMGRDPASRFSVAELDDPEMPAASVEEAIAIGLKRRADLAQLAMSASSARIDARLALAQAGPGVSLTAGAAVAVGWTDEPVVAQALSLGAKVSLPLYDSRAASLQAGTSEAQAALNDLQAAQLRKTLASDIRDYFEGALLQAEKVALAKEGAELAEAKFELMKAQSQYGTATTQDLLSASVDAATAEVNYGTARSAYLTIVQQLAAAMGL
jgi:OMF family outer membrane factor